MPPKKTKKKVVQTAKIPLAVRVPEFIKQQKILLKKHGLTARFVVSNKKAPGIINKIALWVLVNTGSFLDMEFSDRKK